MSSGDAGHLPFTLPDIGPAEIREVVRVLESGWLTTGPVVKEFEAAFAKSVGSAHALAVNSGTAALHLSLGAIGLKAGDEVITTPYTFAATAEVIQYFNARPVFVDVNPRTLNIEPEGIGAAITSRTRAILPVHIAGLPADLDAIHGIARKAGVPVIEDAAHAFPSGYHGKMIGGLSTSTCFSFYVTKGITTGEGGMVCTNDDSAAAWCRSMSLHGISKDAWGHYAAKGSWYYEILDTGFKYNMTDIAAAIGVSQLQRADAMRRRRKEIADRYTAAFSAIEELETPADDPQCEHAWHLYMLRLSLDRLRIDRAGFIRELQSRNIGTSVHFIPLHVHPYYRQKFGYRPEDYPCAYREYMREVSLPIFSRMSDGDVDRVIAAVQEIVSANRFVAARSVQSPGAFPVRATAEPEK